MQMGWWASNLTIAIWSCLINLGRVLDFSPVFLSTRQIRVLILTWIIDLTHWNPPGFRVLTSSDMACRCMMQENPAQTIDLRSSITTWASKTFPVLMGLVRLQRTKPGESSSSEIPFTLALIFSPEVTAVTSMSSDQICSTLTSLYDGYFLIIILRTYFNIPYFVRHD